MNKLVAIMMVIIALVAVVLLALPTVLHKSGLHPVYNGPSVELPGKRALVITTSHGVLSAPGETEGAATGVFGSEMTHPYSGRPTELHVHGENTRGHQVSTGPGLSGQSKKFVEN